MPRVTYRRNPAVGPINHLHSLGYRFRPALQGRSVRVAAQGKTERTADFPHSLLSEVSYAPAQALLGDGHCIVKIHGAGCLHTVFFIQPDFRRNSSNCRRNRRNRRRRQVPKRAVPGQYQHRPGLVWRSKAVKPNVAPRYSSGQIASASQPDRSAESLGLAS